MGVITVAEQKGGIGKTTLAVGIAQYLSEIEHKSVLFVPLDNQGRTAKRVFDLKDNLRV
ncbi:TPA: ParA family protein, partial [Enterobacter cloacae]|nr:ParA family protein [Enterobacter cloacae]